MSYGYMLNVSFHCHGKDLGSVLAGLGQCHLDRLIEKEWTEHRRLYPKDERTREEFVHGQGNKATIEFLTAVSKGECLREGRSWFGKTFSWVLVVSTHATLDVEGFVEVMSPFFKDLLALRDQEDDKPIVGSRIVVIGEYGHDEPAQAIEVFMNEYANPPTFFVTPPQELPFRWNI